MMNGLIQFIRIEESTRYSWVKALAIYAIVSMKAELSAADPVCYFLSIVVTCIVVYCAFYFSFVVKK